VEKGAVLFSGQVVLKLRIKSIPRYPELRNNGCSSELKKMKGKNLAIGLGTFLAVVIAAAAFYAIIAGAFAEVNLAGAVAAISVAVAGLVLFKKTTGSHK
jgi:hypothetical protein